MPRTSPVAGISTGIGSARPLAATRPASLSKKSWLTRGPSNVASARVDLLLTEVTCLFRNPHGRWRKRPRSRTAARRRTGTSWTWTGGGAPSEASVRTLGRVPGRGGLPSNAGPHDSCPDERASDHPRLRDVRLCCLVLGTVHTGPRQQQAPEPVGSGCGRQACQRQRPETMRRFPLLDLPLSTGRPVLRGVLGLSTIGPSHRLKRGPGGAPPVDTNAVRTTGGRGARTRAGRDEVVVASVSIVAP